MIIKLRYKDKIYIMKKITILGLFVSLLFAFSCTTKITTSKLQSQDSVLISENRQDSLDLNFDLEYIVSGFSQDAIKAFNDSIVYQSLAVIGLDANELAVENLADCISDNLIKANRELYDNAEESVGASWSYYVAGEFLPKYEKYFSYKLYTESYLGGAHGISNTRCFVLNNDGKVISEEDLFKEGTEEVLNNLLESVAQKYFKDNVGDDYVMDQNVRANSNFYMTDEALVYVFNPYEIAPYYLGTIELSLPWKDLKSLLK